MSKRLLILFFSIWLMLGCSSCSKEEQPLSRTEYLLNTFCTITLYDNPDEIVLQEAMQLCRSYEQLFSRTIAGSDIDRINKNAPNSVEVSQETAELLQKAVDYGELTDGLFDVTTRKLSSLWDFQSESPHLPDSEDIRQAAEAADYRNIKINGTSVALTQPDAEIDLGGIAKGYIADQLKAFLEEQGVQKAIINLGGNVLTVGSKSDTEQWKVGIRQPFAEEDHILGYVEVDGKSVVTSGVYERSFVLNGTLYHHILDPFTGYPVENGLSAVVVISDRSVDGDALSTSCLLLGKERGMELIEKIPDTEAIFLTEQGEYEATSGIGTKVPFQTN